MGVNCYFGPGRKNRPHATPNYVPGQSKFEIDYYIQKIFLKNWIDHIRGKLEESVQEVMCSSKYFNSIIFWDVSIGVCAGDIKNGHLYYLMRINDNTSE